MDSDLITVEEMESSFDEELLLEPEGEGSTPSKSWAEQLEEMDRVWTAAAQRIIAERSGKVPTACSPDVEVLDTNNNITKQKSVDLLTQRSASPLAIVRLTITKPLRIPSVAVMVGLGMVGGRLGEVSIPAVGNGPNRGSGGEMV
ncbi:hypothetical protein DPMN_108127 [Dreissena polymorpha]|uniref:Uncharacterized protein n=1 Tax=Dreissena polymorpha TaxID=45954 RepID=A0A9D4K8H3_DREPO|nr:hypothetical protein DPMN_108127 [Dreissena polymorpha]